MNKYKVLVQKLDQSRFGESWDKWHTVAWQLHWAAHTEKTVKWSKFCSEACLTHSRMVLFPCIQLMEHACFWIQGYFTLWGSPHVVVLFWCSIDDNHCECNKDQPWYEWHPCLYSSYTQTVQPAIAIGTAHDTYCSVAQISTINPVINSYTQLCFLFHSPQVILNIVRVFEGNKMLSVN